jgi:hypothetical protein
MNEESIRLAFIKAKQDITHLENEISSLKLEILEIKNMMKELLDQQNTQKLHEISYTDIPTLRQINPTNNANPTDNPTVPQEIGGLISPNLDISTGNRGVPTDRQTIRQTDNFLYNLQNSSIESNIKEATSILDSLDRLKKEIRLKFKRVTSQEMVVFSSIYQLEEQSPSLANYKEIALRLGLSESSIRDYVQRMISKGIPLKKQKINNRKVLLSISPDLKRIATLSTIIQLREL